MKTIIPQDKPFTEDLIKTLRTWEISAAASAYDARVRRIDANITAAFVELGLIVKEVKDRELWKHITCWKTGSACHSWDEWVHDALPEWSNGTVYSALGCAEDLQEIPVERRVRIRRTNQETLRKIPPAVRRESPVLEAAEKMTPSEFLPKMQREHPEAHLQAKVGYRFKPTEDERDDIDLALAGVMNVLDVPTREAALHWLALNWLDSMYDEQLTNRQEIYRRLNNEPPTSKTLSTRGASQTH